MHTRAQIETISRNAATWYPLGDGRIVARVLGSTKIIVEQDDFSVASHLVMDGFWESWVTVWCLANTKPSDRVLNIGANCGYFSLLFARIASKVVAVEPQPRLAASIRQSAMLNGLSNLTVEEVVAGVTERNVLLRLYAGLSGSAHVTETAQGTEIGVRERPSGDLLPDATCVFVDAEGYEPLIWEGLGSVLHSARWICLEWAPERYKDAAGFLETLRAWGNITVISADGSELQTSDTTLLSSASGSLETIVVRRRA